MVSEALTCQLLCTGAVTTVLISVWCNLLNAEAYLTLETSFMAFIELMMSAVLTIERPL